MSNLYFQITTYPLVVLLQVTDNGVTVRRVTLYFVEMANVEQISDAKATFECKSDSQPTATMTAEFTAITG